MLPSLSSSYSTSRRRGGDWLLRVDSAGASSSPAAVPAPEIGRGCGVGGRGNPIILGLARLGLVFFVLVLSMRSLVSLYGDVDEGDGGGVSSASQVGGMLSTYPRNRVGVCFPAAAVFSPFGLLYRPTTRDRLRRLRRLFLELSAMRQPMAVKYCLCVQRSKCRSKLSMCQSLRHQKKL